MDNTCPHCGSKKIIPDLRLATPGSMGGGRIADVYVCGAPQALVFKDCASGGLTVRVCGECGYAELHAKNFRQLYEKYEKSRQS